MNKRRPGQGVQSKFLPYTDAVPSIAAKSEQDHIEDPSAALPRAPVGRFESYGPRYVIA
ncbi:MAG: hypothetical protein NTX23_06060 [Candidatus Bipolaricaulota bacterium]|nr:hypothetical protein [Candidatus Bipolaricaulota bacterium]